MISELSKCVREWESLCRYGAKETENALQKCKWNDAVGTGLKKQIAGIVGCHLDEALCQSADVEKIDLKEFEQNLAETEKLLGIKS